MIAPARRSARTTLLAAAAVLAGSLSLPGTAPAAAAESVDVAVTYDESSSALYGAQLSRVYKTGLGDPLQVDRDGDGIVIARVSSSGQRSTVARLHPPTGKPLAEGTYEARWTQNATAVGFQAPAGYGVCAGPGLGSTVTVHDVGLAPDGAVVRLAASYDIRCDSGRHAGDLRYGSTEPYRLLRTALPGFGEGAVGVLRSRTLTVTNTGTLSTTLGQARVEPIGGGEFALADDACSSATLAPAATCTVGITFRSATTGSAAARVLVPDDTTLGRRTVLSQAFTVAPPPAPTATAHGGSDGIALHAWPASDPSGSTTVTSFRAYRLDAAGEAQLLGEFPVGGTHVDTGPAPGDAASYQVRAVGPAGEGPPSATVSMTRPPTSTAVAGPVHALAVDVQRGPGVTWPGVLTTVPVPTQQEVRPSSSTLVGTTPSGQVGVTLGWPAGGLAAGTYPVSDWPGSPGAPAGALTMRASVHGGSCSDIRGTLVVHQVSHRADGRLDVLDADAAVSCGTEAPNWFLQLRVAGTRPVVAAVAAPDHVDAGSQRVGTSARRAVVVTVTGSAPVDVGAATVEGPAAGDATVTASTCAGRLQPGQSCELAVALTPAVRGERLAVLRLADSTPSGARTVPLRVVGVDLPGRVQELAVTTLTDAVHVTFAPPADDGGRPVVEYLVSRSVDGAAASPLTTVPARELRRLSWTDRSVTAGRAYSYTVTAVNDVGAGPATASGPRRLATRELLVSSATADGFESGYGLTRVAVPGQGTAGLPLLPGVPADTPALSPDGRTVAFGGSITSYEHGIAVVARDGTGLRWLTRGGGEDVAPAFSPDGRRIVFTRWSGTSSSLWTVPVAGGTATQVPGSSGLGRAAWTRDGRRLVSSTGSSDTSSSLPSLVVLGVDGTGRAALPGGGRGMNPTLTPDGTTVVYAHVDADTFPARRLTSIRALPLTGGVSRVIASPAGLNDWPSVSLDGRTVAFEHSTVDGEGWRSPADVVTAATAGGSVVNVTGTPDVDETEPILVDVDRTAPAVALRAAPRTTTARTVTTGWSATDSGSGVASYDVRYRQARYDGGYGAHVLPAAWQGRTATTLTHTLVAGHDRCVSVRARDRYGNTSAWSPERCTASPLDDAAFTRAGGFTRTSSTGSYGGAVSTAALPGATLTRPVVRGRTLQLLVSTCPSCGAVTVSVGGRVLGTVSTASATARKQVLLTVPGAGVLRSGRLVVRTTSSKRVLVDGLVVLP